MRAKRAVDLVLDAQALFLHLLEFDVLEGLVVLLDVDDRSVHPIVLIEQVAELGVALPELVHDSGELGELVVEIVGQDLHWGTSGRLTQVCPGRSGDFKARV